MKEINLIVLFFISLSCAELRVVSEGTQNGNGAPDYGKWVEAPKPKIINNGPLRYDMAGFRFNTRNVYWTGFLGDPEYRTDSLGDIEEDNTLWQEIILSKEDSRIVPPKGDTVQDKLFDFAGKSMMEGDDGTPIEFYPLLKLDTKSRIPYDTANAEVVTLSNLNEILSRPSYYDSTYRYLDTAGVKIGKYSGSMLDNFIGETQVILPLESDSIMVNNVRSVISPKYTTPIYWISMIAAQEYFNIDYQFLSGIFAKETNVGTEAFHVGKEMGEGTFDNSELTFGCGEVEKNTFASIALANPHLFPKYDSVLNRSQSVLTMSNDFGVSDVMLGEEYMGKGQFTLKSPYVVNSIFASAHVFFWLWDYMVFSERVCLQQVLEQHEDPYFVPALISLLYNRGLSQDRDSVMWIQYYEDYLDESAVTKLNTGHANYREEILEGLFAMESTSKKVMDDSTIPLYDTLITQDIIHSFFYGKDGSAQSQGEGGFLQHFTPDRIALDNDINELYAKLSERWEGKGISFRYDLLTFLRALKKHFPYYRIRPLDSESQAFFIRRRIPADSCGCDGDTIDHNFPFLNRVGSSVGSEFTAQLRVKDNQGIKSVEWTTDSTWRYWKRLPVNTSNSEDYLLNVSINELAGSDSIWVKVIDNSYNAIIRVLPVVDFGEVANTLKGYKNDSSISFFLRNGEIEITHSKSNASHMSVEVFDFRGRKLKTLFNGNAIKHQSKMNFNLDDLAGSLFIVKIRVDNQQAIHKISKLY